MLGTRAEGRVRRYWFPGCQNWSCSGIRSFVCWDPDCLTCDPADFDAAIREMFVDPMTFDEGEG